MATSNRRERELARARRVRQEQRREEVRLRARRRRQGVVAAACSVAVVGGAVALAVAVDPDPGSDVAEIQDAQETPPATSGTPASATSSASPAALVCPAPTGSPPATPLAFRTPPPQTLDPAASYTAVIATNCGTISVALDAKAAPTTVNSFRFLAQRGYYDDSRCHRLTTAEEGLSVLQCGDPTGTGSGGPGYTFGTENTPADGRYPAGTVAMARAADPDSNGSQFFVVYEDTTLPTDTGGYSVFGRVTEGLDIVRRVAQVGVDPNAPPAPGQPVEIQSVTVREG